MRRYTLSAQAGRMRGCMQLAQRGVPVILYEKRPLKSDAAHKTDKFAELVCSNSLRAGNIEKRRRAFKRRNARLDSVIMACADEHKFRQAGLWR